jgi:hypothetical protein
MNYILALYFTYHLNLKQAILLEKKVHFPKEYVDDASVQNTIETAIREELIQTRSKLKKAVSSSRSVHDVECDPFIIDQRGR